MSLIKSQIIKKILIFPPIILGFFFVSLLTNNKKEPIRNPVTEHVRVLRVIPVKRVDVIPRVIGHGTAEPGKVWRAVTEIRGRVIDVHPHLKPGAIIKNGDIILQIDTIEYELKIAQLEAELEQVKAQLEEIDVKELNDKNSLKIEEMSLEIVEHTLERTSKLSEKGTVSKTQVDTDKRNVLAQKQTIQSLTNSLNLLPTQKTALRAMIAVKEASLIQATLDLNKTVIKAPFECRLSDIQIEKHQFLAAGEFLFEAYSTDVIEIEAQILLGKARHLIHPNNRGKLLSVFDEKTIREIFDIKAVVRLHSGDFTVEWEAQFVRIREKIDQETQTLGFVVKVEKPYKKAIYGKRPPLLKGTFCEVEFRGKALRDSIIIPRTSLHDGVVYVINTANRLEYRPVTVAFSQANFILLESGLSLGEYIVISDPTPAIENMLVDPVVDESVLELLTTEATDGRK